MSSEYIESIRIATEAYEREPQLQIIEENSKEGKLIWARKFDEDNNVEYSGWICSCCRNSPDDYLDWSDPNDMPKHRYCPNCGARLLYDRK